MNRQLQSGQYINLELIIWATSYFLEYMHDFFSSFLYEFKMYVYSLTFICHFVCLFILIFVYGSDCLFVLKLQYYEKANFHLFRLLYLLINVTHDDFLLSVIS